MQNNDLSDQNNLPKKRRIISVIGMMGVGKTTLGHKLATKLKTYFIDSDQEIEERERLSINQIFVEKGEKFFRKIESETIIELIGRNEEMVISLGGGAFINPQTQNILLDQTLVVWLHAPIDEILRRISGKNTRPLLKGQNQRKVLEDLTKTRYPIYSKAHLKFDTSLVSHDEIIENISSAFNG